MLARLKRLRRTRWDPFGRTEERRHEREMVELAFADVALVTERVGDAPYGLLVEIARIPQAVKGFGPVKEANRATALARRETLLAQLDNVPEALPLAAE